MLEYYICNGSNDLEGKPFKNIVKKGKMKHWPGREGILSAFRYLSKAKLSLLISSRSSTYPRVSSIFSEAFPLI